jgi:hypothetical protein
VDTREPGARTGILQAGTARSFDLTTDGFLKGQGGASSCPGLPSFSYYGWAVNITVTGYAGNGHLKAWPYGATEPNASVANYGSAPYALASGQILTGCDGCTDDVNIKAVSAATHVIIDVVGYFHEAGVATSTVTSWAGSSVVVPSGFWSTVYGASCPAGTVLVGGEIDDVYGHYTGSTVESRQYSSTSWRFVVNNTGISAITVQAASRCMDTPIYAY